MNNIQFLILTICLVYSSLSITTSNALDSWVMPNHDSFHSSFSNSDSIVNDIHWLNVTYNDEASTSDTYTYNIKLQYNPLIFLNQSFIYLKSLGCNKDICNLVIVKNYYQGDFVWSNQIKFNSSLLEEKETLDIELISSSGSQVENEIVLVYLTNINQFYSFDSQYGSFLWTSFSNSSNSSENSNSSDSNELTDIYNHCTSPLQTNNGSSATINTQYYMLCNNYLLNDTLEFILINFSTGNFKNFKINNNNDIDHLSILINNNNAFNSILLLPMPNDLNNIIFYQYLNNNTDSNSNSDSTSSDSNNNSNNNNNIKEIIYIFSLKDFSIKSSWIPTLKNSAIGRLINSNSIIVFNSTISMLYCSNNKTISIDRFDIASGSSIGTKVLLDGLRDCNPNTIVNAKLGYNSITGDIIFMIELKNRVDKIISYLGTLISSQSLSYSLQWIVLGDKQSRIYDFSLSLPNSVYLVRDNGLSLYSYTNTLIQFQSFPSNFVIVNDSLPTISNGQAYVLISNDNVLLKAFDSICSEQDYCSGNFTCSSLGCVCKTNYYPNDLCQVYCDPVATCSNQGTCDENGLCVCDPTRGYIGDDCSVCRKGWYGADCNLHFNYKMVIIGLSVTALVTSSICIFACCTKNIKSKFNYTNDFTKNTGAPPTDYDGDYQVEILNETPTPPPTPLLKRLKLLFKSNSSTSTSNTSIFGSTKNSTSINYQPLKETNNHNNNSNYQILNDDHISDDDNDNDNL
ncbi:hypothetical protein CYY_004146 [Polysphondylium violaceum]|uniref:EGF-like domain-containing protein n=1 Tax=Polysphondylium violaceum TaxID=133409 RepID=A0A8J4V820_9MYCE|nr:hypothetical protein CYY_004146 [Polysphondylium violaceum]